MRTSLRLEKVEPGLIRVSSDTTLMPRARMRQQAKVPSVLGARAWYLLPLTEGNSPTAAWLGHRHHHPSRIRCCPASSHRYGATRR